MSDNRISRREFLHATTLLGGVVVVLGAGCGSSGTGALTCTDTRALSDADRALRAHLQYSDRSPDPTTTCSGCRFFIAPASVPACGTCSLVRGPVHPDGKCTSWVAKV